MGLPRRRRAAKPTLAGCSAAAGCCSAVACRSLPAFARRGASGGCGLLVCQPVPGQVVRAHVRYCLCLPPPCANGTVSSPAGCEH